MNDYESAVDEMLSDQDDSQQELEWNDEFEAESNMSFESEFDDEFDDEFDNEFENNLEGDFEQEFDGEFEAGFKSEFDDEFDNEFEFDFEGNGVEDTMRGGPLGESEVDALAREYVGIGTPQEMEAFLGKLFKGVAKKVGGALKGGIGRKILKAGSSLLGRALPVVGSALGTAILPGVGTGLGGVLGGQLKNLFSRRGRRGRRGRRSLGRSLTRRALRSARRVGRRNPLQSLLARGGGRMVRSMFGFEMEANGVDPQVEVARRVIRTVAEAADVASRNGFDSEAAVADAFRRASANNLPPAIRASLIAGTDG